MKENKQNKPWCVRLGDYLYENDKVITRIMIILAIVVYILGSVISYVVLIIRPMKPYEETYDIEFKSYVIEKLENIAVEVIDVDTGIKHDNLNGIVSKYGIEYTEEGMVLNYFLDKEQTISDYQLETGRAPIRSYLDSEEEFNMKVEITKDFKIISKESSLEISQTREEYEQNYPRRILIEAIFLYGPLIVIALLVLYMVFTILELVVVIYRDVWKSNHKNIFIE